MPNGSRTHTRTRHTGNGAGAVLPFPSSDSGRAPSTYPPPSCGGTPGTAPEPPQQPAGRVAAAILTAIRAGDVEAAASIIDSLGGDPALDDAVYDQVESAYLAAAARGE